MEREKERWGRKKTKSQNEAYDTCVKLCHSRAVIEASNLPYISKHSFSVSSRKLRRASKGFSRCFKLMINPLQDTLQVQNALK